MLDEQRHSSEFPDEEPERPGRMLTSEELRLTFAAIEKEISAFLRATKDVAEADTSQK